jgi:hypothetical protein
MSFAIVFLGVCIYFAAVEIRGGLLAIANAKGK